jgi:predicted transcriptional regulator
MYLESVTIKVDEELKRKMEATKENWSAYLREAIRMRIEQEERKSAAQQLISALETGRNEVPRGFVNSAVREAREKS